MIRFGHDCVLSPYEDGVTWWMYWPLIYYGSRRSWRIPRGFETDFASVPRIFTNILGRWGRYGRAAIVHDWLYWTQRTSRKEADDTLLEAMCVLGVAKWQRQAIYWAVRLFGWIAWKDNARLASEGYSRMHVYGARGKCWQRKRLRSSVGL